MKFVVMRFARGAAVWLGRRTDPRWPQTLPSWKDSRDAAVTYRDKQAAEKDAGAADATDFLQEPVHHIHIPTSTH